jgi:hypothetical protein
MKLSHNVICALVLLIGSFGLHAQSPGGLDAASKDAVRRLEEALSGRNTGTTSPEAAPAQVSRGGSEPAWTIDPYTIYSRDKYLAAVGFAANRADAERKALAALTALFGQSVQSEFSEVTRYSEAVSKGIISVSESTQIRDQVLTAASLDSLIGAETGNVWDNGRGMVYAAAYMDRAKTAAVYTALIQANQQNIAELTSMSAAEKNTFDGYARYSLAVIMAGINTKYAQVLSQAGGPAAVASLNLKSADSYSLEAANIVKNTTVQVVVEGDKANRIRDAFAKVLSGEGLRTKGNSPPYALEVNVDMNEVSFAGNDMKYCRYTVSANLVEQETGAALIPFAIADRVGHSTYEGAVSSAFITIEKTIAEKYPALFKEYLSGLLPKKR